MRPFFPKTNLGLMFYRDVSFRKSSNALPVMKWPGISTSESSWSDDSGEIGLKNRTAPISVGLETSSS